MIARGLLVLAVALPVEAVLGYPDALFRRIGHPVTWMGALLARLDRVLNRERDRPAVRRLAGLGALLLLLLAVAVPAVALTLLLPRVAALRRCSGCWRRRCRRSARLWAHVRAVADGLERDGVLGRARGGEPDRGPRPGAAGRARGGARRDREPGGELLGRRGGAGAVVRCCAACPASRSTRRSTPPTA